jgi:hypothetical protein
MAQPNDVPSVLPKVQTLFQQLWLQRDAFVPFHPGALLPVWIAGLYDNPETALHLVLKVFWQV